MSSVIFLTIGGPGRPRPSIDAVTALLNLPHARERFFMAHLSCAHAKAGEGGRFLAPAWSAYSARAK